MGGKLDRRRLCEMRTERAKGGAEIHGKTAGAYGPIFKRDYFNFHNKKMQEQAKFNKSIGSLCSPGAPFLCLSELDPEGHRQNYSWL